MRSVLVTTLMLVAVGCSYPEEMLVSANFSEEEEQMVKATLAEWEEATDTDLGLKLVFGWRPVFEFSEDTFHGVDGKATLHITDKGSYGYQDVAEYYEDFRGYTRYYTTWSTIIVRYPLIEGKEEKIKNRMYGVLLHEFGHYFGQYDHKEDGLMHWRGAKYACIDSMTLEDMCQSLNCGPNAHQTCTDKGYPDTYDGVFGEYN